MVEDPFTIIVFKEKSDTGLKPIDLVQSTWILMEGKKNYCKYPPADLYGMRDKWLQEGKDPEESWEKFPVTVLATAKSLEKGRIKLDKARKSKNVETTDSETRQSFHMPNPLSKQNVMQELKKVNRKSFHNPSKEKSGDDRPQKRNRSLNTSDDEEMDPPPKRRPEPKSRRSNVLSRSSPSSSSSSHPNISSSAESSDGEEEDSPLLKKTLNNRNISASSPSLAGTIKDARISGKEGNSGTSNKTQSRGGRSATSMTNTQNDGVKLPPRPTQDSSRQLTSDSVESLKEFIRAELKSAVKSLQIDNKRCTDQVKNTITAINIPQLQHPNAIGLAEKLQTVIPIETLEDFLIYDNLLKENEEERTILLHFFKMKMASQKNAKKCAITVLSDMLSVPVQSLYTFYGRVTKGESKKAFGDTQMWKIVKCAVIDRVGQELDEKLLQSQLSKWFSQNGDRAGGRKKRAGHERRSQSV